MLNTTAPAIVVPIVTPTLPILKNIPFANSGACGAADTIQYWAISLPIPANNPHNAINIIVGIFIDPNVNTPKSNIENIIGNDRTVLLVFELSSFAPIQFPAIDAIP